MAKKLSSVLGVDIGCHQVKVAEIKMQGKQPVVTALGMAPTPPGSADHTGIFNADAIGAAVKQAIKQSGASVGAAVVSLAGQSAVLVRTLEVPRMTPDELREHMQWEINRNIPFTESSIVSDFKAIPNGNPNATNMDVVMAIAPQSAIDAVITCVRKAGKAVAAIDVEPLGLARTLHSNYDDMADKTVCIVEIGHKTSSINIYKGEHLMMPRQVLLGGELFTQEIAREYGVPEEEAEAIKRDKVDLGGFTSAPAPVYGAAEPTQFGADAGQFTAYNPFAEVEEDEAAPADEPMAAPMDTTPQIDNSDRGRTYRAMQPLLDELVSEIRRSVDYYRSRGDDVDLLLVCGGGGKLKGLPQFLQASTDIACDAMDPMRRLNVSARKLPAGFVEENKADFAVAVGNGLHAFYD